MLFNQKEIEEQEFQFGKSTGFNDEFAETKLLINDLKKAIARLDELTRNGVIRDTENHQ
jgi:hypothetical protein